MRLLVILALCLVGCGTQGNEDAGGDTPDEASAVGTSSSVATATETASDVSAAPATDTATDVAATDVAATDEGDLAPEEPKGPDVNYVINTMATLEIEQTWETMLPEVKALLLEHATLTRYKKCVAKTDKRVVNKYELSGSNDDEALRYFYTVEIIDSLVVTIFDGSAKTLSALNYFDPRIMCPQADH